MLIPAAYAASKPAPPASRPRMVQGQTTVTGTIIAEKNEEGKVAGYALREESGQSMILSKHGKGKELRKMVGKKVEVVGTLEEVKGQRHITVKEFKEIK